MVVVDNLMMFNGGHFFSLTKNTVFFLFYFTFVCVVFLPTMQWCSQ